MKKKVTSNLAQVIFTLCVTLLFSCKDESKELLPEPIPQTSTGKPTDFTNQSIHTRTNGLSVIVSQQNGRLIFESEEDFETGMNEIKELNTLDWNDTIGFNSMWKQLNLQYSQIELDTMDELPIMDDEALLGVLNPYGIVQINPWIFKLNGDNRTVYALHVSKISKIGLLNNAVPSDIDIRTFSFDDDVFSLLETEEIFRMGCDGDCRDSDQQGPSTMQQYCSRAVGNRTVKYERKGKVSYLKGGIWKVMKMKFKHKCKAGGGDDKTTFGFVYQYFYQTKCNSTGSGIMTEAAHLHPQNGTLIYNVWTDDKHVQEFYKGTRCLSNFSLHYPGDLERPTEVLHLDQCLINGGGYGYLYYDVGSIFGS